MLSLLVRAANVARDLHDDGVRQASVVAVVLYDESRACLCLGAEVHDHQAATTERRGRHTR